CRRTQGRTHVAVADLPPSHVTAMTGAPMTTPARTVIDIARSRPFAEALVLADAAMRRGVSRGELERLVAQHGNWPGMRSAQQVVRWADERSESPCESVVRARFILLGLPLPEP